MLAIDAHLPISTAYRYLHEGITVLAMSSQDFGVGERARVLKSVLDGE